MVDNGARSGGFKKRLGKVGPLGMRRLNEAIVMLRKRYAHLISRLELRTHFCAAREFSR